MRHRAKVTPRRHLSVRTKSSQPCERAAVPNQTGGTTSWCTQRLSVTAKEVIWLEGETQTDGTCPTTFGPGAGPRAQRRAASPQPHQAQPTEPLTQRESTAPKGAFTQSALA